MNYKFSRSFRGQQVHDGALLADWENFHCDKRLPCLTIDHVQDPEMKISLLECVKAIAPEQAVEMLRQGREFGRILHVEGKLDVLPAKEIAKIVSSSAWHRASSWFLSW